jgi:hypothetical protein
MVAVAWFFRRKEPEQPLVGGRPRVKTYSAETGYVYQYTFAGQRTIPAEQGGTQFVFDVTAGRTDTFRIRVFVSDAAIAPWSRTNGRDLAAGEQYAIAKIALQRFLDVRERGDHREQIAPDAGQVESILDELGV